MPTECTAKPLQRELADSIIRYSSLDELRILLACGARANEPVTQGLHPLHYAVWQRYTEAVHFLLVRGSDVNARDDCGYSALHLASEHGYVEIMNLLLEFQSKVDFDISSSPLQAEEPMHLAIKNGHYEAARLLLEHGANPNSRYFFGSEINLISPLNTTFMELLLLYGAFPDSRDRTGLTPLMKACRLPQAMESVLLLISHGANVNAQTDERHDFRSVLHYGVLSGNQEIVKLLLKQGATVNRPPNDPGSSKPTPLDLAILKGDPELVKILLDSGADVNASSPIIGSPLHVACADNIQNCVTIVRLLLDYGANPNIVVSSEDGTPLQPVLGEYLLSNDEPREDVVSLLLRHGTQVILKSQLRDPLGILNTLPKVSRHRNIFLAILEAAESFDIPQIRRLNLPPDLKQLLQDLATQPLPMKQQIRFYFRRLFQTNIPNVLPDLPLPSILHRYLLFEIS